MLNKAEFVTVLAERCELTKKDATEMYENVFGVLAEVVSEGNEVSIPNFGRIKIVDHAERNAHNSKTGESVVVPAKKIPKFQFSKNMKEAVASL